MVLLEGCAVMFYGCRQIRKNTFPPKRLDNIRCRNYTYTFLTGTAFPRRPLPLSLKLCNSQCKVCLQCCSLRETLYILWRVGRLLFLCECLRVPDQCTSTMLPEWLSPVSCLARVNLHEPGLWTSAWHQPWAGDMSCSGWSSMAQLSDTHSPGCCSLQSYWKLQ